MVYLFSGLRYYSFSKIKLFDKCFENLWVHPNTKWKKKSSSSNIFVFGDTWWISGQLFSLTVCVLKYNSMQPRCHWGTRDPCQVQHCYILLIFPFTVKQLPFTYKALIKCKPVRMITNMTLKEYPSRQWGLDPESILTWQPAHSLHWPDWASDPKTHTMGSSLPQG